MIPTFMVLAPLAGRVASFVGRFWKPLALAGALAAGWWYHDGLQARIASQARALEAAAVSYGKLETRCTDNEATLRHSIKEQNDAIQALQEAGRQEEEEANQEAERLLKPQPSKPVGPGAANLNRWLEGQ